MKALAPVGLALAAVLAARTPLGAQGTAPSLTIDGRTVPEGGVANAAFRVTLSSPSSLTVTVDYRTIDGTAKAGEDYTATTGTLTFTPGRTQHSLPVPILSDALVEGTEIFRVRLENPQNAVLAVSESDGTIVAGPSPGRAPVYRAYSPTTDYHFFTLLAFSRDFAVGSLGYRDESMPPPFFVARTQETGSVPLFRLYNPNLGRHYYTATVPDRDFLMSIGMVYEGDEGFIFSQPAAGLAELFRLYNRNSGTHLFTADVAQKDGILTLFPGIWEQHASVGWVYPPPAQAYLIRDINTTEDRSPGTDPGELCLIGDTLFFAGTDEIHGRELWKSDGTPAGTRLVRDLYPGPGSLTFLPLSNFRQLGGILYFAGGTGVWRSDGTVQGTYGIAGFPPDATSCSPPPPGARTFYAADGGGQELFVTDGVTTVQLTDRRSSSSFEGGAVEVAGQIFIGIRPSPGQGAVWKTDGTSAGTAAIKDGFAAPPTGFASAGSLAYFNESGSALWRTDGSAAGTFVVDPEGGSGSAGAKELNGSLIYGLYWGGVLRTTNGSTFATVTTCSGFCSPIGRAGSNFFWKYEWISGGNRYCGGEVGKTGGTPETTVTLGGGFTYAEAVVGDVLYFNGGPCGSINPDTGPYSLGRELWKTDGSPAVVLKDIVAGGSSDPQNLVNVGGTLFFSASTPETGRELWKSDGTEQGTVLVKDITPGPASSGFASVADHEGTLFFRACVAGTGCELWRSDGTEAGTRLVADIWPGPESSEPEQLTSHKGRLYFVASDANHGRELWVTDGTTEGTLPLQDFNPGPESSALVLIKVSGGLLLAANDGVRGREPWFLPIP